MATVLFSQVDTLSESENEGAKTPAQGVAQHTGSDKTQKTMKVKKHALKSSTQVKKRALNDSKQVEIHFRARKPLVLKHWAKGPMPQHCEISLQKIQMMVVRVPRCAPLKLKMVSHNMQGGKKRNGAAIWKGVRWFQQWSCLRVFGACTRCTQSEVSTRGITDLANQIRHWEVYSEAVRKAGKSPGMFVSPLAAEWFSGLPRNWTNPRPGRVAKDQVDSMFPEANDRKVPCISVFTGVAGLELGLRHWLRPVVFVERDNFCVSVLQARQQDGLLPKCDIVRDVKGFKPIGAALQAEMLTGGFPCQGISSAGLQQGLKDDRSRLVVELFCIFDRMPRGRGMLLENVGALISKKPECRKLLAYILKEARNRNMSVTWSTLTLANCGLAAGRKRVFILIGKDDLHLPEMQLKMDIDMDAPWNDGSRVPVEDWLTSTQSPEDKERLKCMGNIVVPVQAKKAISVISGIRSRMAEG